jgi:hypothetical protein
MGMHRQRIIAITGGLAVVVGTLVPIAGLPTGAAAAPAPVISVSPHTDLADRDVVTVSGVGLEPLRTVVVRQCAPTVGACRFDYLTARTDGTGTFARTVKVRRLISRPDASAIDCATTVCRIVVTDQSDATISLSSAAITFDPGAPFSPAPTVTITPDTALPPVTGVTVRGAGFARNMQVAVSECVLGAPDRCVGLSLEMTDATGRLDAPARVARLPFDLTVDCATAHCVIQVVDASRGDVAGARLGFDASVPVPTIELDPSGPLPYLGHVTAIMHHFTPGVSYAASECYGRGGCDAETTGTADPAGDLRLQVAVRRIVSDLTEDGPFPVDCATQTTTCFLQIEPGNGGYERLSVPLTFDPTTSPTVRVGSTTVRETDGPQFAQVPVTLNAQSTSPVSVHFTIYGFTARAGTDFVAEPGTLVIPPGTTRGAIAIVVLGDTHHERPETLLVTIDQPTNATIADGDAVLTIHDDD